MGKKSRRDRGRTIVTPTFVDLGEQGGTLVADGKLAYWKMVLPEDSFNYIDDDTGEERRLDFDRATLTDLAEAFQAKALDQTAFQLADADNAHTMDPERFRGEVTQMALDDELPAEVRAQVEAQMGRVPKGLFARLEFPSKKMAKAVRINPNLGVSARIREGIEKIDGRKFKRAIIHVLGTLDPKITGMGGWLPAVDLSEYASAQTIDLSDTRVEVPVSKAKNKGRKPAERAEAQITVPDIEDLDPADIGEMDDATLAAFLDKYGHLAAEADDEDVEDEDDVDDEDEDEDEDAPSDSRRELAGSGAKLSNKAQRAIDLANTQARNASKQAGKALRRTAKAEWDRDSNEWLDDGVPPYVLDLAEPALRGAEDRVIDLSESGGDRNVNVTKIIRELVDGYRGTLDLSEREQGHGAADGDGVDPYADTRQAFAEITADL